MESQDFVYYRVFPRLDELHSNPEARSLDITMRLEQLKAQSLEFALSVTESYIWQHEPFNLRVCSSLDDLFSSGSDPSVGLDEREIESLSSGGAFIPHLFGKVKFGDNLEDEWLIVYLLLELSRRLPTLSITVRDSDGEFLLVESAFYIPKWLKPENSHDRIFLRQGAVHFIPLQCGAFRTRKSPDTVSLKSSLQVLEGDAFDTKASAEVQSVIFSRISGYPGAAKKNVHRILCSVPLPVAQVLKHEPQLIAFAVESFYCRESLSMKVASRMERFSPRDGDGNDNMVKTVVRMSRLMHAQLAQQTFQAPRGYPMPPENSPAFKGAEIGMKIAFGFEIMYWEGSLSHDTDSAVRGQGESRIDGWKVQHLSDWRDEPRNDLVWKAYKTSLERNNYFRGLQKGCREHRDLLQAAISRYHGTEVSSRVSSNEDAPSRRIAKVLGMPFHVDDFSNVAVEQSDEDLWLYNWGEEVTTLMTERRKDLDAHGSKQEKRSPVKYPHHRESAIAPPVKEISANVGNDTPENLEIAVDVVNSVKAFVNNISSFEGAEIPTNSDKKNVANDEDVNLDMKRLAKEFESVLDAKEVFNLFSKRSTDEDSHSSSEFSPDDSTSSTEDDLESPAFDIVQPVDSLSSIETCNATIRTEATGDFGKDYSILMKEELKSSSLVKSFVGNSPATGRTGKIPLKGKNISSDATKVQDNDIEKATPATHVAEAVVRPSGDADENDLVDVDVNLLESLLRSYTFQQGMPGPASNLLGSMGVKLPDNSDPRPVPVEDPSIDVSSVQITN